jgi:hypothetical protein
MNFTLLIVLVIVLVIIYINNTQNSTLKNNEVKNERTVSLNLNYKDIQDPSNDLKYSLTLNTSFLSYLFDSVIDQIQKLVRTVISEEKNKLNIKEINSLIPRFLSSVVENQAKLLITEMIHTGNLKQSDELKKNIISFLQQDLICKYILHDCDIKTSTEITNSSISLLNMALEKDLEKNNVNIPEAELKLPEMIGKITFDMAKSILENTMLFDENGNLLKLENYQYLKNTFTNILNKYLPYKDILFEINNNGTENLPGFHIKFDQLKDSDICDIDNKILPVNLNLKEENLYKEVKDISLPVKSSNNDLPLLNMIPPQTTMSPNMMSPQTTMSPNMMSPQTTMSPNMMPPQTTMSPNMMPPQTTMSSNMMPPQTTMSPNMMPPQRRMFRRIISPQTTMTPTIIPPKSEMDMKMMSLQTTMSPNMMPLQNSISPNMMLSGSEMNMDMMNGQSYGNNLNTSSQSMSPSNSIDGSLSYGDQNNQSMGPKMTMRPPMMDMRPPMMDMQTTMRPQMMDMRPPMMDMQTTMRPPMMDMQTTMRPPMMDMQTTMRPPMMDMQTTMRPQMMDMQTTMRPPMMDMQTTMNPQTTMSKAAKKCARK